MASTGFRTFDTAHLVTIAVTVLLPMVLSAAVSRAKSDRPASTIASLLAGLLLVNEGISGGVLISEFGMRGFVQYYLPLHVCGIAVFLTAAALLFRNQQAYELAYFWGLVGASNAVLTPGGLEAGFPSYRFFQFFTAHSGIVAGVVFATWGLGMRPTLGGLVRAFAALNLLAAVLAVINFASGANYMFLCAPPVGTRSPFFFAPWPWYILFIDALALVLFFVVLLPFLVKQWLQSRTQDDCLRNGHGTG